jgi:hypothetical protein
MKYSPTSKLLIAALCSLAYVSTFAASTFIVESGAGGQHAANYTESGFAVSGAGVGLPGCTATTSRYSGTGTYFGPSRYAQYTFTPTMTGYYELDLAWISTAGQTHTAVNLYTGAATGGAADIWGNAGGPQGVITSGTMNMYYAGVGAWNPFTTAQLTSGTAYHLGLYGGYKTPYAGGATPADPSANRVTAGAARFIAATPTIGAYGGPANGATDIALTGAGNDLSWAAGNYDSFFDVWFGTAGNLTRVLAGASATTLSFDPDSVGLLGNTQYFWRVDALNVDVTTTGTQFSFTTIAVPEPSTALLSLLGGLGMMGWMSRRRTA